VGHRAGLEVIPPLRRSSRAAGSDTTFKGIQCSLGEKQSLTVKNGIILLKSNSDLNSLAGWITDQVKSKF
jgi:hypothetical protein